MSTRILLSSLALAALAWAMPSRAFFIPIPSRVTVIEYVNEITGHYVLLANEDEMSVVDRGGAGPGWRRTGYRFGEEWIEPAKPSMAPVCRFYSPSNNSHFFTANPVECEFLRTRDTGWTYEKAAFEAVAPVGGTCPPGRTPIYRVYNNRHAFADANHRFVASTVTRDTMVAAGWIDEGIAFCPKSSWVEPDARVYLGSDVQSSDLAMTTLAGCDARGGSCVAVQQLPAMATTVASWLPPFYVTRNPDYPWNDIAAMTGLADVPIRTSLPAGAPQLLARSFLQAGSNSLPMGIHVNGADRLQGPYASMSPMYRLAVTASSAGDDRVYPWPHRGESTLTVSVGVTVKSLRRSSADAHAYGGPVLHFVDGMSGSGFWMTLQTFGTVPQGDFVGLDVTTGTPIVSTSFRERPAFGRRVFGEFARCFPEAAVACLPGSTNFQFAIGKADFARVLAMAQTANGALSPDPARYFLQSFRFQAETYLDASISMALSGMGIEIWPF
jgi:hypothetical protein